MSGPEALGMRRLTRIASLAFVMIALCTRTEAQEQAVAPAEQQPAAPAEQQPAAPAEQQPAASLPQVAAGYPTTQASQTLYDELDYQRAVQAYIWATPLVNSVALEKALVNAGVSPAEPTLLVFDKRIGPKQIIMTGNSQLLYAFSVFDLAKTGPVIVEVPAGMSGGFWDAWERGIEDVGLGRSAQGGKFMLLPPGATQAPGAEFIPVRSRTPHAFLCLRGILDPGGSTEPFVKLASSVKLYTQAQKDRPTKLVLNGGKPFDSDWPKDVRFFEYLAEGLGGAIVEPEDKLMYAMLEPLGIVPGKALAPDERQRALLARAADTGHHMVVNLAFANRSPQNRVWADRTWERGIATTTPNSETQTRIELDERAQRWYQRMGNGVLAYSTKPVPGTGHWYASTCRDRTGAFLDGTKTYRLTLASNPPGHRGWSVTVYDNRTRSMIDTDQQRAALSSHSGLKKNADGSIDLYFGPSAPKGLESNWIKTIPGQGFFAMLRLESPLAPVYDGSWKLADIEEVKNES